MKKNKNTILLVAGAAVVFYLLWRNRPGPVPFNKTSMIDDNATDKSTAITEDGQPVTAFETSTGDTAIKLPGGVTITQTQAKKLKGKLKTAALTALTKLKSKRGKKTTTAITGFENLPILF